MKKLLLLLLLLSYIVDSPASETKKAIVSIICTLNSDIFSKSLSKIIETIKTKELVKIINDGISVFHDLKKEFEKCSKKEEKMNAHDDDEDDDVKLGYPRAVLNLYTIIGKNAIDWYDKGGLALLKSNCYKYYGQNKWFCTFIRKQS